ncbi:MAG TPA: tetratricopeptide repeat protein [Candidatus Dormibacteraeota bacterium]|nr:tetratricopeptide repeat protein [Candidatus Dormibacteraeota bacterium]
MPKANRPKELLKRIHTLMKKERWQDAIKLVKENASVVENHSELLWNFGWCYFKLERMNEAQKYLTRAMPLS